MGSIIEGGGFKSQLKLEGKKVIVENISVYHGRVTQQNITLLNRPMKNKKNM